jgi:hypothetical protein
MTAKLQAERVAGRVASALGQPEEACRHFDTALNLAKRLESPSDIGRVAFDYAQVLEALGDATGALARYRLAYRARDRIGLS